MVTTAKREKAWQANVVLRCTPLITIVKLIRVQSINLFCEPTYARHHSYYRKASLSFHTFPITCMCVQLQNSFLDERYCALIRDENAQITHFYDG